MNWMRNDPMILKTWNFIRMMFVLRLMRPKTKGRVIKSCNYQLIIQAMLLSNNQQPRITKESQSLLFFPNTRCRSRTTSLVITRWLSEIRTNTFPTTSGCATCWATFSGLKHTKRIMIYFVITSETALYNLGELHYLNLESNRLSR